MCAVYDLASKELLYEEEDASAVAWNAEVEEMVCFSSAKDGGTLAIKTANFPLHKQKLAGFVVGFRGSKIYCLHYTAMQAPPCLPRLSHASPTPPNTSHASPTPPNTSLV